MCSIITDLIKSAYCTTFNKGSFGGKARLNAAVLKDTGVCRSGEDVYTLHRPVHTSNKTNRVAVNGIERQFQADFVNTRMYSK